MRLPRLTTRRLMVLVAVVAPILFIVRLRGLSAEYKRRAASLAADEVSFRKRQAWAARMAMIRLLAQREAELARRRADYYAALKRTYDCASRRPWLAVPPDPPPPE